MVEIALTWTWELLEPLHCGTGSARAGYADRLVYLDGIGNAAIRGDAVKGALRMSAEQVAEWLGCGSDYRTGTKGAKWQSEPASPPLARLFGGGALAHFEPARLESGGELLTVTSTAIDAESGTALTNTLRVVQTVAEGARFTGAVRVSVPGQDVPAVATLLLAALAATENVGAKAGIGWGSVQVLNVGLMEGESPVHDLADAVSATRLGALVAALRAPRVREVEALAAASVPSDGDFVWHQITLTPTEPTTLAGGPDVSNVLTSEAVIRATTVRGAMAGAWLRSGRSSADVQSWLHDATRWSPGFPRLNRLSMVPVPASLMTPKHHRDRMRSPHTRALFDDLRPESRPEVQGPDPGADVQWVGAGGGWTAWSNGRPQKVAPRRSVGMHVARDYTTGSKVDGALFAREVLHPGDLQFVAFARIPRTAASALPQSVLVGKRKSAGNGQMKLKVEQLDPSISVFGGQREAGSAGALHVYVQLLSPAFVVDETSGFPLRSLDAEWWCRRCGVGSGSIKPIGPDPGAHSAARTPVTRRGNWMNPWGHGRAAAPAIAEGSVWRLSCRTAEAAAAVRAAFPGGIGQIGERQHEGFGWIAVDPAWVGVSASAAPASDAESGLSSGQPKHWPGLKELSREDVVKLVDALPKERALQARDTRSALHELARLAREASNLSDVAGIREFYNGRVDRAREDAWTALGTLFPEAAWRSPESLRFVLEGLLIRATPEAKEHAL